MGTQTISAKFKILPDDEQSVLLLGTMEIFRDACNYISEYVHRTGDYDFYSLNKIFYHDLRDRFSLGSQMTQSVMRCVVSKYRAMVTNAAKEMKKEQKAKEKEAKEKEKGVCSSKKGKSRKKKKKKRKGDAAFHITVRHGKKDIELDGTQWRLVRFRRPQCELVWNKDYSITEEQFSVNTLSGRMKVLFEDRGMEKFFAEGCRFGEAKLVSKGGKFFLYVGVTVPVPDVSVEDFASIVGVDGGLRFAMVSYDSSGETVFFDGKQDMVRRAKYKAVRRRLQRCRTPSARRRIKKMGDRENRWARDRNHCRAKALVESHPRNTLFMMEDLSGIRGVTERVRVCNRYVQVSWPFYDLQQKVAYKAASRGSVLVLTNPKYTSQRCPVCGKVDKSNRDHREHSFACTHCGYRSNDDRVAAMNIYNRGVRYVEKCRISAQTAGGQEPSCTGLGQ